MKKLLVLGVAIVTLLTGCNTTMNETEARTLTDVELMNEYVAKNYGDGSYGRLLTVSEHSDDIAFFVDNDSDGSWDYYCSVDRDYCASTVIVME